MPTQLNMVKKLDMPAGYKTAFVRKVFKALGNECLFVGGCVRDALRGVSSKDLDIATPLVPDVVIEKLKKANIAVIPTGIEHGTVTAVNKKSDKEVIEITTLRKDVSTDGRRAVVAYTTCWKEDAERRDFTFNSLLMDLKGCVYDPTGLGLDDLKAGRIRFIGNAEDRVKEDYLRILRYFRFATRMNLPFDDDVLSVFEALQSGLSQISIERITDEVFKILSNSKPQRAIEVLRGYAEFSWMGSGYMRLDRLCALQEKLRCVNLIGRIFLISSAVNLQETRYLNLPKKMQADISQIIEILNDYPHKTIEYMLYYYDHECIKQAAIYMSALDKISDYSLRFIVSEMDDWSSATFPLRGADLLAEGYEQGPLLGKALKEIELWWIEEKLKPKRDACMHEAIKWLEQNRA
ncbi:MAG: CCA tRNA nucleotidyltransferase [Pseudomonadota bacterium]|nr:CCA tRNA nucleotidyltransferase [Pseudomonadota bacterium]MED5423469.1 CCA tRNA nucleotidyltransferase [Pseudomonadota bacterium]